ncbi:MAG: hypothetical protein ACK5JS_09945 [Mangrovibacterium sp.]
MRKPLYLLILIATCSACKKSNTSSIIEPVSLNIQISETRLDVSEEVFHPRTIDGPEGESVDVNDFFFYFKEKDSSTTFDNALTPESTLSSGKCYDIYASTVAYTDFGVVSSLSFPTREATGELYEGFITTDELTYGENSITIPVALKTFHIDVDFKNKEEIVKIIGNFFISVTQNEESLYWSIEGTENTAPAYGLGGEKMLIEFLDGTIYSPDKAEVIKSITIESPEAGKRYVITPTTNATGNISINLESDWEDAVSEIEL